MLTKTNWTIMLLHGNYDVSKTAPKLHTHTRCEHANTRWPPCGWHDEALGVDVMTPRQARSNVMKNSVMWRGAFLQGTATGQ